MEDENRDSRRDVLKKIGRTATFVIPTMTTFHMNTLAVPASSGTGGAGKISVRAEFKD